MDKIEATPIEIHTKELQSCVMPKLEVLEHVFRIFSTKIHGSTWGFTNWYLLVQKALPSIKTLKAHHLKHFHPKDHDNECSNKISIHLEAHEKYYPKDDATMDVKCVPQRIGR